MAYPRGWGHGVVQSNSTKQLQSLSSLEANTAPSNHTPLTVFPQKNLPVIRASLGVQVYPSLSDRKSGIQGPTPGGVSFGLGAPQQALCQVSQGGADFSLGPSLVRPLLLAYSYETHLDLPSCPLT